MQYIDIRSEFGTEENNIATFVDETLLQTVDIIAIHPSENCS
jgi:hypothetical protein